MSSNLVESMGHVRETVKRIMDLQRGSPDDQRLIFHEYVSMFNSESLKTVAEGSIFFRKELEELEKEELELDVSSSDFLMKREERRQQALLEAKKNMERKGSISEGGEELNNGDGRGSETFSTPEISSTHSLMPLDSGFVKELYELNVLIEHGFGTALCVALRNQPEEEEYHESFVMDYEHLFERSSSYLRAWLVKSGGAQSLLDIICFFQLLNGFVTPDVIIAAFHRSEQPLKSTEDIKGVLKCMQEYNVPVTVRIAELLEKAFARCMKSEGAEKVYKSMIFECGLVPLTTRLFALVINEQKAGMAKKALRYYEEMLDYGIRPEPSTLRLLCTKCKNVDELALSHFTMMSKAEAPSSPPGYGDTVGTAEGNPPSSSSSPMATAPLEGRGVFTVKEDGGSGINKNNLANGKGLKRVSSRRNPLMFFFKELVALAAEYNIPIHITDAGAKALYPKLLPGAPIPMTDESSGGTTTGVDGSGADANPYPSQHGSEAGGVSLLDAMRMLHRCEVEGIQLQYDTLLVDHLIVFFCRGQFTPVEDLVLPFYRSKAYYPVVKNNPASISLFSSASTNTTTLSRMNLTSSSLPAAGFSTGRNSGGIEMGWTGGGSGGRRAQRPMMTGAKVQEGADNAGGLVTQNAFDFNLESDMGDLLEPLEMEGTGLGGTEGSSIFPGSTHLESDIKEEKGVRGRQKSGTMMMAMGSEGSSGGGGGGVGGTKEYFPHSASFPNSALMPGAIPLSSASSPSTGYASSPSGMATISQEIHYVLTVMSEYYHWELDDDRLFHSISRSCAKRFDKRLIDMLEVLVFYQIRRTRERVALMDKKSFAHRLSNDNNNRNKNSNNNNNNNNSDTLLSPYDTDEYIWICPIACAGLSYLTDRYNKYHQKSRMGELMKEVLQQYYEFSEIYHIPWERVARFRYPPCPCCMEGGKKVHDMGDMENGDEEMIGDPLLDPDHAESGVPHTAESSVIMGTESGSYHSVNPSSSQCSCCFISGFRHRKWTDNIQSLRNLLHHVVQCWRNPDWTLGVFALSVMLSLTDTPHQLKRSLLNFYDHYYGIDSEKGIPLHGGYGGGYSKSFSNGGDGNDSAAGIFKSNPTGVSPSSNSFSFAPSYIRVIEELVRCEWNLDKILQSSILISGVERKDRQANLLEHLKNGDSDNLNGYSTSQGGSSAGVHIDCNEPLLGTLAKLQKLVSPVVGSFGNQKGGNQGTEEFVDFNNAEQQQQRSITSSGGSAGIGGRAARERADSNRRTLDDYLHMMLREIRVPRSTIDWYRKRFAQRASQAQQANSSAE